ncbi:phenylacetate-CoA ligase [Rhodocyclaceae bacterium]|nr:phenylacetate-CoA ligase [Rhodocyclaceae bacterium]
MSRLKHWLHRRQRPARYALLEGLLATQAMTREQVLRKQAADRQAMVRFARDHTTYYREAFAGLPDDVPFASLPILSKEAVRQRLPDLLADNADSNSVRIGHTGGSTGKPLAFYYDEAKHELMRAGMCRSYMMSGWRPGEKILNFWGARQDTQAGGVFGAGWGDFIAAEKTVPAHEFTADQLRSWAREVCAYRPVLLQGYTSILAALARFVGDHKMAMPDSLRGVYSTAEVLDDGQRQAMEQAFGCKVFNQYGSREVPNIACECRHGNMHVFTDMVQLESERIGDEDRLLVTSLTNRLMPFIRYDIGDSGRLREGDCACGSPFPLMEMGMCRKNDLIRTRSGKTVHPSYFNRLLYGLTGIEQYQFVQTGIDRIVLNVVSASALEPGIIAALRRNVRSDVDAEMQIEVAYPRDIERTASGKHRFVISNLPESDLWKEQP